MSTQAVSLMNFFKYAPASSPDVSIYGQQSTNNRYLNLDPNQRAIQTVVDDNTVVFPHNIYSAQTVPEPDNNSQFIDVSTVYFTDANYVHPLHFSKFGRYNGCPNGYCYGSQSGRNYNLPAHCHEAVPHDFWRYWNSKDYDFKEKPNPY